MVAYRLNSHLIPHEELSNGGYENLSDGERWEKIKNDYSTFIKKRSLYVAMAAQKLCKGEHINATEIIQSIKELYATAN